MGTLRTPETEAAYTAHKKAGGLTHGCVLCKSDSVKEFTSWRIIENQYPYDLVAKVHHMILPKRHVPLEEVSPEEWQEYQDIKASYIQDTYEFFIEPSTARRSIPEHWHLHLLISKHEY